ncbi:MAG: hypothetical protein Q4C01_03295 [Clostridia bacterium]|nr:hypothetical protein [Clostridia bacterium]
MSNQTKNQNSYGAVPKIDLSELSYGDKLMLADMDEGFPMYIARGKEREKQRLMEAQRQKEAQEQPKP